MHEIRLAARSLRRSRGYTAAVVTSLALGLTFVAATFSIVNAYLLRPLPFRSADRLFHVRYAPPGPFEPSGVSSIDWGALRDVVEAPITAGGTTFYIGEGGYSAPARAISAGPAFLDGLGVAPVRGRTFVASDFDPSAERVALIGDGLWRARYGADSAIVGRLIHSEAEGEATSQAYRVIGVLPPGFWFGRESSSMVDVVVPLQRQTQTYLVRLRDGVTIPAAERRITDATRLVAGASIPADWTGVHLESMRDRYVATLRPVLIGITIAAALVLVIVCANIAVLTLLRAMRRQKEMSVRVALGAGRGHFIRMLGAETVLLAVAAVLIALALTSVVLQIMAPLIETNLGRPAPSGAASIRVDSIVLLVAGGAGLLIALSLAFLPLMTPWRRKLAGALLSSGRSMTDSRAMRRIRLALIVFEISASLVLLAAGGSMIRNVAGMVKTDLGFRADRLARVSVVVPGRAYPDTAALLAYYQRMTASVGALVNSPVALTSWPPFAELPPTPVAIDGREGERLEAGYMSVGAGYFAMLAIPLRQGREFAPDDLPGSAPVAVVSESMARRTWPGESPIGKRIRTVNPNTPTLSNQWRTIVGVVADVRQTYDDQEQRDVYAPYFQSTPGRFGTFYVRSSEPTPALIDRLRVEIARTDPLAIVRGVRNLASEDVQLAGATFLTSLLTTVAGFAVLLALFGIYGVMAYAVRQREREIAIRVAIGATGPMVLALFLRHGGIVVALGTAGGIAASLAMGRILASRLAGFREFDIVTLAMAAGFMLLTGLAAVWWPARRAAATSPAEILNSE